MGSYVLKKAEMDQLSAAMDLISDGKRYLKEQGSNQWQTGYPDETDIREDILRGRGYFVTDGTQPLAYLCVDCAWILKESRHTARFADSGSQAAPLTG